MEREVVILKAMNGLEAICALEMMLEKMQAYRHSSQTIDERVIVTTNEIKKRLILKRGSSLTRALSFSSHKLHTLL
jgi:hypothetical protein